MKRIHLTKGKQMVVTETWIEPALNYKRMIKGMIFNENGEEIGVKTIPAPEEMIEVFECSSI